MDVSPMKAYQRKALLERVERDAASVGARTPDSVEVDGVEVALEAYLHGDADEPPEDDVVRALRRRRKRATESIEEDDLTYDEGLELAAEVAGITRALELMRESGSPEREARAAEKADEARWNDFVRRVRGRDGNRRRR
ncbi:MAG: DUF5788 family protein [Halobacteriales archaeon]